MTLLSFNADGKDPLTRQSAPIGSSAYTAVRPHASAHGFTDTSFQPIFHDESSKTESSVDGKTAAVLAAWARQVARGEVKLDPEHDEVRQLAHEVTTLTAAKVNLSLKAVQTSHEPDLK